MKSNFFNQCYLIIIDGNVQNKCQQTIELYNNLISGLIEYDFVSIDVKSILNPGRPEKPQLVPASDVPKRKVTNPHGHAGLIHALAHIEFNAINLALDACYRFQNMPLEYYLNWLQVASEEVYHFQLLNQHLDSLGFSYGEFAAHNGLCEMATKTEHDFIARMGLIPRTLEARGIDAVPEMQHKLQLINDVRGIEILEIIKQDEIKHVAFGDSWYKYACAKNDLDYEKYFFELLDKYKAPKIRGPFNRVDRKKAGFNERELDRLQQGV